MTVPVKFFSFTATNQASPVTGTTSASIPTGATAVIVVADFTTGAPNTISAVSDGVNTYTLKQGSSGGSASANMYHFYSVGVAAVSSGATISFTCSGGGNYIIARGYYIAGVSGVDKSAQATGIGSSLSVSSGTLSQASEIAIGAYIYIQGTLTSSGAGFTQLDSPVTNSFIMDMAYEDVASTGSITYGPSQSTSSTPYLQGAILVTYELSAATTNFFNPPMLGF